MAEGLSEKEFDDESSLENPTESPEALKKEPLSIKQYFEDQAFTPEQQKVSREILRHFRKVNVASFFELMRAWQDPLETSSMYVPAGKKLDGREKRHLEDLKTLWDRYVTGDASENIKNFFSYIEATRWHAGFAEKQTKDTVGALGSFVHKKKIEREKTDKDDSLAAYEMLSSLLADSDMDATIESLTQQTTTTKKERKALEKTQKEQGRGTVSESSLQQMLTMWLDRLWGDSQQLMGNIASYFPEYTFSTAKDFLDALFASPKMIGTLRMYARLAPNDFLKLLTWWMKSIAEQTKTRWESAEKIQKDKKLIEDWLNSNEGKEKTEDLVNSLDQKFRGIALSLEKEKGKIEKQLQEINTWVIQVSDAERMNLVKRYAALEQSQTTMQSPETTYRFLKDIVHIGGLVSVIPQASWLGWWASFRLMESEAKSRLQSLDVQVGWFQWIGWPNTTSVWINLVLWGTLHQSRKNTLFYALNAGTWLQLVSWLVGFGWNAGLTFGDEFWINEQKMKKLTPQSKVMIGAFVWASLVDDFKKGFAYKPLSFNAGVYARRDKLAWLNEQQGEIYVTALEILKQTKDFSVQSLRTTIQEYCTAQDIKQTPEQIDRVARVLHMVASPYASAPKNKSWELEPERMNSVAEQIALNRFNTAVDEVSRFALTGIGLWISGNFLGIYPAVGVQAQLRKSSVYTEDKDSQVRAQEAFEQPTYDEKLPGSFADNIDRINQRFGLTEKEYCLSTEKRQVADISEYSFVSVSPELLSSSDPVVEIYVAPLLVSAENTYNFQKIDWSYHLPGTVPVSIIDKVVNGHVVHQLIVWDTMGKNAVRLTGKEWDVQFATDDTWVTDYQTAIEREFFDEKVAKTKENLYNFLEEKTTDTTDPWVLPFDLQDKHSIKIESDNGVITAYKIKLQPWASFVKPLPQDVTITLDWYLSFPATSEIQLVYSAPDNKWMIQREQAATLSFGYALETDWFNQSIDTNPNIDLLTNVSPDLRSFISSTEGAEMLMAWRYDGLGETNKEKYYILIKNALKNDDYQEAYDFANTYIQRHGTDAVKKVFMEMAKDGIDTKDRANLYLIYGALSRVRMTEYKHLTDENEKLSILNDQLEWIGDKISEDDKTYLRDIIWWVEQMDLLKVQSILKKADPKRFEWRWDTLYYYNVYKDRTDPMYRLIFLFAPIHKVYETRTTATRKKLEWEFVKDTASRQALMNAYGVVQNSLKEKPEQLFADQKILSEDVGLVFGYGETEIEEKFVFYPKITGEKIDLEKSWLSAQEQIKIKLYYLKEYIKNNPHDVKAEVDALVTGISKQLLDPQVSMDNNEKQAKIAALKEALYDDQGNVKKDAYTQLMSTWTIKWIDWFNNPTSSKNIVTFKVNWWLTTYSDCVNFTITKSTTVQMHLNKVYQMPHIEPEAVALSSVTYAGEVVAESTVVLNQADRRVQNISLWLMGGVLKDPETGESTTLPVDISEEDYDSIQKDSTPSSMTISTTWEQVNAFAWSLRNKSGMFYIDSATGNWKFFEGTISGWVNNTLIFTPASNKGDVLVSDVIYAGRHQGELGKFAVNNVMVARIKNLPYDAYRRQMIDLRKSAIDRIKKSRKQSS